MDLNIAWLSDNVLDRAGRPPAGFLLWRWDFYTGWLYYRHCEHCKSLMAKLFFTSFSYYCCHNQILMWNTKKPTILDLRVSRASDILLWITKKKRPPLNARPFIPGIEKPLTQTGFLVFYQEFGFVWMWLSWLMFWFCFCCLCNPAWSQMRALLLMRSLRYKYKLQ